MAEHDDKSPLPNAWIAKQSSAITVTVVSFLLFGGGGLASHSTLGGKIDAQGDKLDRLTLALSKFEGKIDANDATNVRLEATLGVVSVRVGLVEQKMATIEAQIQALREKVK